MMNRTKTPKAIDKTNNQNVLTRLDDHLQPKMSTDRPSKSWEGIRILRPQWYQIEHDLINEVCSLKPPVYIRICVVSVIT